MSFIDDILNTLAAPLRQYSHPPSATLLVLGAAIVLSLITMSANRFLVNYKMIANSRREYMAWTSAVRKAKKDGDEKALEKLMRRQSAMMKMSSRSTFEQFKTYPITIVPFLLIYYTVVRAIGSIPVAYAPLVLPFTTTTTNDMFSVLSLFYWYLICSFTLSIPLSRLFGVQSSFSMTPTTGDSR
jgi:uncharacterized membrane protein (DUF106 family)